MDGEIGPADHFKARSEVRAHVKRKRDEGAFDKPFKQRDFYELYGFRPQEVNLTGAVSLVGCRLPDLSNAIHPLLSRDRFDDTPDAIYDQLVPALRLASLYLTESSCMQFWVTMAFGDRTDDLALSQKHGRRCLRISKHVKMTAENVAAVVKLLNDFGTKDLIHFTFKKRLLQNRAWGCSGPIYDYSHNAFTKSVVRLHGDYYVVAKKLSILKYPEISQKLRFNFLFAVLIVHELVSSNEEIAVENY